MIKPLKTWVEKSVGSLIKYQGVKLGFKRSIPPHPLAYGNFARAQHGGGTPPIVSRMPVAPTLINDFKADWVRPKTRTLGFANGVGGVSL